MSIECHLGIDIIGLIEDVDIEIVNKSLEEEEDEVEVFAEKRRTKRLSE